MRRRQTRRQVLRALGLAGAAGLAGCQGEEPGTGDGSGTLFDDETTTTTGDGGGLLPTASTEAETKSGPGTETATGTEAGPETLTVGVLSPVSGPFPDVGRRHREAAQFAVERLNASPEFGVELDAVYGDTGFAPDRARQAVQRLLAAEDVDALVGGVGAGAAFGTAEVARRSAVVYLSGAQLPVITGSECNDWTFRVGTNTVQLATAVAEHTLARLGPEVYFLYNDFAYGNTVYEWTRRRLAGATAFAEVGSRPVSLGGTEFGGVVEDIRDAGPDAVVLGLAGESFGAFLDRAAAAGLGGETALVAHRLFSGDRDLLGESADGLLAGMAYDHSLGTGNNRAFVRSYERAAGREPEDLDRVAADSLRVLASAVEEAGRTTPDAVRETLEGGTFQTVLGSVTLRAADHQATNPAWVGELSAGAGTAVDLAPRTMVGGDEALPPAAELGCER